MSNKEVFEGHSFASKSISSQRVVDAPAGKIIVSNYHSMGQRVCQPIPANASVFIKKGNCSGGRVGVLPPVYEMFVRFVLRSLQSPDRN